MVLSLGYIQENYIKHNIMFSPIPIVFHNTILSYYLSLQIYFSLSFAVELIEFGTTKIYFEKPIMFHANVLEISLYFIAACALMVLGVIVNKRLYQNVKNEEHLEKGKVIQRILKTFAWVQCYGWPSIICLAFILKLNAEVLDLIPIPVLHRCIKVLRAMYTMINNYVGFNSLIIAITRYLFIIHDGVAERIGIKRLRSIFVALSIGIPMITSMINESINPVEEAWSSIFVPNYNPLEEETGENNATINISSISPLLHIPDRYIPSFAKFGMRVFWFIMLLSTYSNILEGIMYLRIYIYYFR